jgi:hypothetical protein
VHFDKPPSGIDNLLDPAKPVMWVRLDDEGRRYAMQPSGLVTVYSAFDQFSTFE